jgi:hypothetical protein
MPFGVIGGELHGLGGEGDGVVVAIKLGGVLRHALVELARALGFDLAEALEHLDGGEQVLAQHENTLQRQERLDVARREIDDSA